MPFLKESFISIRLLIIICFQALSSGKWVASRKTFAVPQDRKQSYKDDESDDEPAKKKHCSQGNTSLPNIASGIKDIRQDLNSIFKILKNAKLPLGLHKQLQDAFKCNICSTH